MNRRAFLTALAAAGASLSWPRGALALQEGDRAKLAAWVRALRGEPSARSDRWLGLRVDHAGRLALGSPYVAGLLDAYLAAGGDPRHEPLTLDLSRFDCVLLVEGALAVARLSASSQEPTWSAFGRQIEQMRYRDGRRTGYASRLHYFSEWIADNARRGLLQDLGQRLGGQPDRRPLRFMTTHRASYAALRDDAVFTRIAAMERSLDDSPRWVVPTERIAAIEDGIRTGDVLAFATRIEGLDATHTGLAHRDERGVLRVLHAPLSGGAVEISARTLPEYVSAIRSATGIMVARPLVG